VVFAWIPGEPLLMRKPELVYKYLDVGTPFQDVLLIPVVEKGSGFEATIWIVAHNETRKFDDEDSRVMQSIASFVVRALSWGSSASNKGEQAAEDATMADLVRAIPKA
jgi:hypothetical protein